jgi:hypothetical protein
MHILKQLLEACNNVPNFTNFQRPGTAKGKSWTLDFVTVSTRFVAGSSWKCICIVLFSALTVIGIEVVLF